MGRSFSWDQGGIRSTPFCSARFPERTQNRTRQLPVGLDADDEMTSVEECQAERLASTLGKKIEDRKMPVEDVALIGSVCKKSVGGFWQGIVGLRRHPRRAPTDVAGPLAQVLAVSRRFQLPCMGNKNCPDRSIAVSKLATGRPGVPQ